MPAPMSLVIFDCDGVLVDSEPLSFAVEAACWTQAGFPLDAAGVRQFLGLSAMHVRATMEREHGRTVPEGFDANLRSEILASFTRDLRAIDGIEQTIATLRERGTALCVASSSDSERIAHALRITHLYEALSPHLFSATMVARGKPAPDLFLLAASRMGTAPEDCVVIEDSEPGVRAGVAAGMHVIGFVGGSHCGPDHASQLRAAGAHDILRRMTDLPGLLQSRASMLMTA